VFFDAEEGFGISDIPAIGLSKKKTLLSAEKERFLFAVVLMLATMGPMGLKGPYANFHKPGKKQHHGLKYFFYPGTANIQAHTYSLYQKNTSLHYRAGFYW